MTGAARCRGMTIGLVQSILRHPVGAVGRMIDPLEMVLMRHVWLLAGVLTGIAGAGPAVPALAQSPVAVQGVWARATPPHAASGAIYMTLTSPTGDTLVGASTPVATSASVHESSLADGIMRMRPVEGGLNLPPGQAVALQPGGYHLMLEGLKTPMKQGEQVPVHLTFRKASPVDVMARVQAIGASSAGGMAAEAGMKMSH